MKRLKLYNGLIFIALGIAIAAQILHGVGLRFEALPGVALGAAMVGLGVYRIAAFSRT